MNDFVSLPRVVIRKSKGKSSLEINFERSLGSNLEGESVVDDLLMLANDWTSFCIAGMMFTPSIAQAGYFWLEHTVDEEVITFLNRVAISKEVSEEETGEYVNSYILHEDDLHEVAKKLETTTQIIRAADSVKRSTLGSLIAEFDYFLLRLLQICAKRMPEKFFDEGKSFSIRDIRKFGSLDDLISAQVSDTISQKLRESHSEIVSWIIDVFDLSADSRRHKDDAIFRDFIEVCQRRHILTHNGGIVNETYVEKCKSAGLDMAPLPKIGERAEITQKYLMRSTARVYLTGFYLIHLFIQKVYPTFAVKSYRNLLSVSHSFLEQGLTKMACRVIDFAEVSSKKFDNELKLKFGINRALCKLFDTNLEVEDQTVNAKAVLDKYDWSVSNPVFALALKCISRDFSDILVHAKAAAAAGLEYSDARTFVVFREARRLDGFLDCFPRAPLRIAGPTGEAAMPQGQQ